MSTIINDRIDVRISKQQKELIKHASVLKGFKSLTEFVVFCISNEANNIIKEHDIVLKTIEDKKLFVDAILNPPKANDKLKRAQMNHSNFIKKNESKN
ncbi:type II toxin-antitoxin system TacA family antitoxin [Flavobacterium johnsoniae]|uniref:type II toxin-antitoxin system TacA family antitoxin n=1 Tax=Flavobacterium johnsoniae TaxID=986 RepID=UPI0011EFE059|nr:DUF1778 domain-containing protein [Flavobacterium johnsoniae]